MGRSSQSIIVTKGMRVVKSLWRAMIIGLVAGFVWTPALAAPQITETTKTYNVSETTARGLRSEMRNKGPKGFWGYTRWDIRWTPGCRVSARIVYTLPQHSNPEALPDRTRRAFDRMVANLAAHERLHGQNGINAAHEISRANCKGGAAIIRKYNRADKELDRRTNHGARDGVTLD